MNKYKLSKKIDVNKSTSVMGLNESQSKKLKTAAKATMWITMWPVVGAIAIKNKLPKEVKEITTLEELDTFTCVDTKWNTDCIYVEHPRIPKRLIEDRFYKDYILKELMSEIFDFITDHIPIKKIVLGLETKKKLDFKNSIPINSLVSNATLGGSLNSHYICTMEDVECSNEIDKEYPWLVYYPDIVSAVKKGVGKLEIKQSIKMNLNVNAGIKSVGNLAFNQEKDYSFYVYYEKAITN